MRSMLVAESRIYGVAEEMGITTEGGGCGRKGSSTE
jgi:hypothetical protein